MELILLKDVEQIGRKGEVIRVREGFGRNYLLPQNLALEATKENRRFIDDLKARAAKRREAEKKTAQELASKLEGLQLSFERESQDEQKIFGSVTGEDIREALEKKKYSFTKKQVQLKEPIRSVGVHPVNIEIYPQVKATISVEVVAKS